MGRFFTISSVLAFILIQEMDSHVNVFSVPMWFKCSSFSALSFSAAGIIICLPFILLPSTISSYLLKTSMAAGLSVVQLWLMTSHTECTFLQDAYVLII